MNTGLLLFAWLTPLLLAPFATGERGRWLPAVATLPALAGVLLLQPGAQLDLPWLLLGVHLGLDDTGRIFLAFSTLLWLVAALYSALSMSAERQAGRLRVFFLLAMAGNLLLIVAADMLAFYLGFALMGLSASGLVAHRSGRRARTAARVYLGWTLVGELALLSALLLLAASNTGLRFAELDPTTHDALTLGLLLTAFGIKLGLPGLHLWLPLAYRASPPAMSAVLAGPMISAGLLGLLRHLPLGVPGFETPGGLMIVIGAFGSALGVVFGVMQTDPRSVLAYSSIAKMGLLVAALGVALQEPAAAPLISTAVLLFAMHHLLVKGALFLGIDIWLREGRQRWMLAGLVALALSLAGAPFSGGAAAKTVLSDALAAGSGALSTLLLLSALGTSWLMARLVWLLLNARRPITARPSTASWLWLGLVPLALWLPWTLSGASLSLAGSAPLVAGLALAAVLLLSARRLAWRLPQIPPGDLFHLLPRLRLWSPPAPKMPQHARAAQAPRPPIHSPPGSRALVTAGVLWMGLLLAMLLLLMLPARAVSDTLHQPWHEQRGIATAATHCDMPGSGESLTHG